eukprot:gene6420-10428_t
MKDYELKNILFDICPLEVLEMNVKKCVRKIPIWKRTMASCKSEKDIALACFQKREEYQKKYEQILMKKRMKRSEIRE